jgi:hypothetical protein
LLQLATEGKGLAHKLGVRILPECQGPSQAHSLVWHFEGGFFFLQQFQCLQLFEEGARGVSADLFVGQVPVCEVTGLRGPRREDQFEKQVLLDGREGHAQEAQTEGGIVEEFCAFFGLQVGGKEVEHREQGRCVVGH